MITTKEEDINEVIYNFWGLRIPVKVAGRGISDQQSIGRGGADEGKGVRG